MAKQLNVDLNIRANTQNAKAQFQDLQNALSEVAVSITKVNSSDAGAKRIKEASVAAQELQKHLSNAVNADTGKLNLNKFNMSLKQSKSDLSTLSNALITSGATGEQAFAKLATSIAAADRPVITMGTHLKGLLTTLKNTARWQISSTILHGFMSSIQGALNYAKELNQSLNNIRIVTGQSTDQMAKFAAQANKSAKALGTTTTEYAKASLIYYQQGLSTEEVQKRTDVTMKMANVSRQSAEEVSSQMTAIWNNFDDGSHKLDYYADVMTKLGATTASSSSEIAEGLSKFAAVADTVGLSYDKAAASVATVVAETRQSADVVGTAFKTMFARMEGLKLGNTLEDGVDLNQYSEALSKVGVNILDSNNEIKEMDTILDEVGEKWDTIGQSQKIALAETVAGVRQYTQFMALMNNYDKVQANEQTAQDSSGTLEEQQKTYEEGWEAARKHVKASLEGLWSDLLDDKFFTAMTEGFAQLISGIDGFVKGLGGVYPLLMGISSFFLSNISGKIQPAVNNLITSLKTMFQTPKQQAEAYGKTVNEMLAQAKTNTGLFKEELNLSQTTKVQINYAEQLSKAKNELMLMDKQMTPQEKQIAEIGLQQISIYEEQVEAIAKKVEAEEEALDAIFDNNSNEEQATRIEKERAAGLQELIEKLQQKKEMALLAENGGQAAHANIDIQQAEAELDNYMQSTERIQQTQDSFINKLLESYEAMSKFKNGLTEIEPEAVDVSSCLQEFVTEFDMIQQSLSANMDPQAFKDAKRAVYDLSEELTQVGVSSEKLDEIFRQCFSTSSPKMLAGHLQNLQKELLSLKIPADQVEKILSSLGKKSTMGQIDTQTRKLKKNTDQLKDSQNKLNQAFNNFNPKHIMGGVEAVTKLASAGMQAAMVINSFKSAINAIGDKDMQPFEKVSTILMAIGMGVPSLIGMFSSLTGVINAVKVGFIGQAAAMQASALVEDGLAASGISLVAVQRLKTAASKQDNDEMIKQTAAELAHDVVLKNKALTSQEAAIAQELENAAKAKGAALTEEEIASTIANTVAQGTETSGVMASIGAKIAATAAQWGFNAAMDANPVGVFIIAITALIAALTALTLILIGVANAESEEDKAIREAEESLSAATASAKELAEAEQEAKEKAQGLKEAFDKYDTIYEKLSKCTKGTQAWNTAMNEINTQVHDMISQYPELLSKVEDLGNGVMGFSKETQKEVQKLYNRRASDAANATIMGQADIYEKELDVQKAKVAKTVAKKDKIDSDTGERYDSKEEDKQKIIDNANEYSSLTKDQFIEKFKDKLNLSADELTKFYEKVQKLGKKINETATAVDNAITIISQNSTKENYSDKSSEEQSGISNTGEAAYKKEYDKAYKDLIKQNENYSENSWDEDLNSNSNAVWKRWLKAKGYDETQYTLDKDAINGNEKNRTITFTDANGDEKTLRVDAMAKEVAASEAGKKMDEAQKKMADLTNSTSRQGQKFIGGMTYDSGNKKWDTSGSFENLTAAQQKTMKSTLGKLDKEKNMSQALKDAEQGKGKNATEYQEMLKQMGLTADQFIKMQKETGVSNKDLLKGLKNVESSFTKADKALLAKVDKDNKGTSKERKDFVNSYNDAKKNIEDNTSLSKSEKKDFKSSLAGIVSDNKGDMAHLTKFQKGLQKVDLTSKDAAGQVEALAKKYKISGKSVNAFIESLEDVDHHFGLSTKSIEKEAASLSSIVKDLNTGSTVKEEDLKKLKKAGVDTSQFFTKMSDGTYKLTAAAEDFKDAVSDITSNKLRDRLKGINQSKEETTKKYGTEDMSTFSNKEQKEKGGKVVTGEKMVGSDGKLTEEGQDYTGARLNYAASFSADNPDMYKGIEGADAILEKWKKNKDYKPQTKEEAATVSKMIDAVDKQQAQIQTEYLSTAKTVDELNSKMAETAQISGSVDYQAYAGALIGLASQYTNTTKEIEDYNAALKEGDMTQIKAAEDALQAATLIGESAEKYGLDAADVETQAKLIAENYKNSKMSEKTAARLAIANQRMNKGVKDLHDNWSTWSKTLKSSNHTTKDYAEALNDANEALANLTGAIDGSHIPINFLNNKTAEGAKHLDWMSKAAKGNKTAINQLGVALANASVKEMKFKNSIKEAQKEANKHKKDGLEPLKNAYGNIITEDTFKKAKSIVNEFMSGFEQAVAGGTSSAQSYLDNYGKDWVAALNEMAAATGMSVKEMNSLMNQLGVDVEVTTTEIQQKTKVPKYTTVEKASPAKYSKDDKKKEFPIFEKESYTYQSGTEEVTQTMEVAQINAGNKAGTPPKVNYVGTSSSSSSTGGVSNSSVSDSNDSSSDSNNTSAASQEHTVNRYSNEENAINGLTKQYSRLNQLKDQAYGAGRIQAMEQERKKLEQLKNASEKYLEAIAGKGNSKKVAEAFQKGTLGKLISKGKLGGDITKDYKSLFGGQSASGKDLEYTAKDSKGNEKLVRSNYSLKEFNSMFKTNMKFNLDSFGNIQNKDAMLKQIENLQNQENRAYSKLKNPSAASTTQYNKRSAYLAEIKERIEQYGSTAEKLAEKREEYLNKIAEIQEKNAEIITAKMEHGVELGQHSQTRIERSLKLLGDTIYTSVGAMAKWYNAKFKDEVKSVKTQANAYSKGMKKIQQGVNRYNKKDGETDSKAISPAKAVEALKTIEEGYASLAENIQSIIDEGKTIYSNTLEAWKTKIEEVTTSIANNAKTLDHFQKVLGLLGKSMDYASMGTVLQGQKEVAEADYEVKKSLNTSAKNRYDQAQAEYEKMKKNGASKKELEEFYNDTLKLAKENYETTLADKQAALETVLEKVNAVFENEVNRIFQESENKLTGEWGSFDALDAAMKRQQSVADEYLTKTNQLYETNKMLRNLQKDVDKTDSQIAKTKLKGFADEIQALQTKEKLTKADLKIAQAKYEVLKAQIALEEAQNAKSTVRLKRDSEGNYGYVYTANQDKVSDAEQALADKSNALYNVGLETAQNYAQKLVNMRKEMDAELRNAAQKFQSGEIASEEEYNRIVADIRNKYHELELTYTENYNNANLVLNETGRLGEEEAWTSSFKNIIEEHKIFSGKSGDISKDTTKAIKKAIKDLNTARNKYTKEAKVGNKELADSVKEVTDNTENLKEKAIGKDGKGGLVASMDKALKKSIKLSAQFATQYDKLCNLVKEYTNAANKASKLADKLSTLTKKQKEYNTALSQQPKVTPGNGSAGSYGNTGSGGGDNNSDSTPTGSTNNNNDNNKFNNGQKIGNGMYYISGNNFKHASASERKKFKNSSGSSMSARTFTTINGQRLVKFKYNGNTYFTPEGNINQIGWDTFKLHSYDTGGYTGDWNSSDGKLAFLHQKELVLNATDTENILSAVKLIRDINDSINLQALAQSANLQMMPTSSLNSIGQNIQQEVTIHAEFPNVNNHYEIEEAFNNLVNQASQYAHRNQQ